jgi:hypothetical protein
MRSAVVGIRFTYRDGFCMLCICFLENSVDAHAQS